MYNSDNAGKAKSNGVEAEFIACPVQAISLGSAITFNDAVLTSVLPGVALTPGSILPDRPDGARQNYAQATTHFKDDVSGYYPVEPPICIESLRLYYQFTARRERSYNKLDLRAGLFTATMSLLPMSIT